MMKINNFRGDLIDISAKTKALQGIGCRRQLVNVAATEQFYWLLCLMHINLHFENKLTGPHLQIKGQTSHGNATWIQSVTSVSALTSHMAYCLGRIKRYLRCVCVLAETLLTLLQESFTFAIKCNICRIKASQAQFDLN